MLRKESPERDEIEAITCGRTDLGAFGPVHDNRNVFVMVARDQRRPNRQPPDHIATTELRVVMIGTGDRRWPPEPSPYNERRPTQRRLE
jgi:hypothetical protein